MKHTSQNLRIHFVLPYFIIKDNSIDLAEQGLIELDLKLDTGFFTSRKRLNLSKIHYK